MMNKLIQRNFRKSVDTSSHWSGNILVVRSCGGHEHSMEELHVVKIFNIGVGIVASELNFFLLDVTSGVANLCNKCKFCRGEEGWIESRIVSEFIMVLFFFDAHEWSENVIQVGFGSSTGVEV